MKIIKIELPKTLKEVEILPLADLHLGDAHCDLDAIKENIKYIAEHDNVYTVLNGDLINNATKTSVSDVYSEMLTPSQQLHQVAEMLKPIKDKILCMTNGNHENRAWKQDGIDLSEILAIELGIREKYAQESALLFIKVGENVARLKDARGHQHLYSLYVKHGVGGGRKVGGKVNNLEAMSDVVDADIYIMSHVHLPAVFKENYFRTDFTKQTVIEVEKLFLNTGAYLKYGGYGESFGFTPANRLTPTLHLSGTKKKAWATL